MTGERGRSAESDAPECETCGKADCPDADLPGFSEPRECMYAPIYHALKDAKDCDYGCARDYTNQTVRLWVVEAVEQIVTARLAEALRDAASDYATGGWLDAFTSGEVEDDESAVRATDQWLRDRADELGGHQ